MTLLLILQLHETVCIFYPLSDIMLQSINEPAMETNIIYLTIISPIWKVVRSKAKRHEYFHPVLANNEVKADEHICTMNY